MRRLLLLLLVTNITLAFRGLYVRSFYWNDSRSRQQVLARTNNDDDTTGSTDTNAESVERTLFISTSCSSTYRRHCWESIVAAVLAWQWAVAPPAWASTVSSVSSSSLPTLAIISPGYLIQPRQYESYAEALRKADVATLIQSGNEADSANDNTAAALYRDAVAVVGQNAKHVPVVLIGHSRGGAVAAIAAMSLNNEETPPLLVLLDPVDTMPPTALLAISSTTTTPTTTPTATTATTTQSAPVLIVSLPYGGYSSFYKTYYESACAPAQRNGDAFAEALSLRSPSQRVLQVS